MKGWIESLGSFRRWHQALCSLRLALIGFWLISSLFLVPTNASQAETKGSPRNFRPPDRHVGFSVFGPDWTFARVFANEAERLAYVKEQGYLVAKHTSRLYGNLVRVPISVFSVLDLRLVLDPELVTKPVYQVSDSVISGAVDKVQASMDASLAALEKGQDVAGRPLHWDLWDAFFSGIQRYNFELGTRPANKFRPVYVDLFMYAFPPTLIIEAPSEGILRHFNAHSSRERLWDSYIRLHLTFIRKLVQRYGRGYSYLGVRARIPIAVAVEMFNEPDYGWLPDEAKIEKALNPDAYPCDKYITQLHLSQIPENDLPGKGCVKLSGFYREQDLGLPSVQTPLEEFRWGRKFDMYVSLFADLHEHASFAARDEIHRGGAKMAVVSSAVTHVNTDWFMHMFRTNRKTFSYTEAVAVHPYHWPQHDIHDIQFVGPPLSRNWMQVNPREFATHYFKRFDFIRALGALVAQKNVEKSFGLAGKRIWITEFGIPTKKLGKANSGLRDNQKLFIYERGVQTPRGIRAIVWEDKWEAFLNQVSADFLRQNHVETFLVYSLRESAENETNDDNHSNFALYRADWSSRLAPDTLSRLADLFLSFRDG
jgi:hypothetical protein